MTAWPFMQPCIPTLVDKPPEGEGWAHEIKYDGYRTQLHLAGRKAKAFTKTGIDWSKRYAPVLEASRDLIGQDAVLDGEMVVQDETGRSDFHKLASAIRWDSANLVFYAFDLLAIGNELLRYHSCLDRRSRLHELIGDPDPKLPIQFSEDHRGSGALFFAAADAMGLEGIVSKRLASVYRHGPSRDWLKTKSYVTGEFVVTGYQRTKGAAPSLLLAAEVDGELTPVGRAVPAVGGRQRDELWQALEFLKVADNNGVIAVPPVLRVKAKHLRGEAKLRHATVTEVLIP